MSDAAEAFRHMSGPGSGGRQSAPGAGSRWVRATRLLGPALIVLCLGWSAGARAQTQIGVGGVDAGMTPDEVEAALLAQGQKVFSKSARYVEAILFDGETKGTVRVRFLFDDAGASHIKSVEFVEDDEKATRQYLKWSARLASKYGPNAPREIRENSVQDNFCHSKNISVVLALFEQRAVMAYFFNPQGSPSCQRTTVKRDFDAIAYDSRPPGTPPPVARSTSTGAGPGKGSPEPKSTGGSPGPSPLAYAPNRSPRFQTTLRCIGVAAYYLTPAKHDQGSATKWNGIVRRLSSDLVNLGRAEGLVPQQVDAEGRAIVKRNHAQYDQGVSDGSGRSYFDLDQDYCRSQGML